jgi:hypothetical protein
MSSYMSSSSPTVSGGPTTGTARRTTGSLGLLLSQVLDGPVLTFAGASYYGRLAEHVAAHDPETVALADALAARVRGAYRSQREHALVSGLVPFARAEEPRVRAALDSDCAICLKPLRGPQRLIRTRATGPAACGHFFHRGCFEDYETCALVQNSSRACPLCRADLSYTAWEDHESDRPRF